MHYVIYILAGISILLAIGGFAYNGPKKVWVVLASIVSIIFSYLAITYVSFWPLIAGFALNWLLKFMGLEPTNSEVESGKDQEQAHNKGFH